MANDTISNDTKVTVYYLSYGGLLPFIASVIGFYVLDETYRTFSMLAFITYAAVIIGFVGAVHWGFLLKEEFINRNLFLGISVLPGLIGWAALLTTHQYALIIFVVSYPLLFVYEKLTKLNDILPDWYMKMRLKLTMTVTILVLIMLINVF